MYRDKSGAFIEVACQKKFPMKSYSLPLAIMLVVAGCQAGTGPSSDSDTAGAEAPAPLSVVQQYQFVKVFAPGNTDDPYRDSVFLQLKISGDSAYGVYDWSLPGKDGKRGTFTGHVMQDSIAGQYHYQQEGGVYDDPMIIFLRGNTAIVTLKDASGYPLTDTLPAVP